MDMMEAPDSPLGGKAFASERYNNPRPRLAKDCSENKHQSRVHATYKQTIM